MLEHCKVVLRMHDALDFGFMNLHNVVREQLLSLALSSETLEAPKLEKLNSIPPKASLSLSKHVKKVHVVIALPRVRE